MKNSILNRYLLYEYFPPFGVGLFAFTFVLILHYLFLMMDLFLNRGVGIEIILKMAGLVLPMFIPLSIPMASLLAALVSYGRLSEDGEITALRSSGCSFFLYSRPVLCVGIFLSGTLLFFNLSVAPWAHHAFSDLHYKVVQKNPLALFSPRVLSHFGEYKVLVDQMDRKKRKLTGIGIYKMNLDGAPTRILAPEGEINFVDDAITIELKNGAVHQPNADKNNEYTITKFNKLALSIPAQMDTRPRGFTPREMTTGELRLKVKQLRLENKNSGPWSTETHMRVAIAFAPLVFIVLGIGLGVQFRRGSRSLGVGLSLLVLIVYYGLFMLVVSISSQGLFSPLILTWIPNFIALLVGTLLFNRLVKR